MFLERLWFYLKRGVAQGLTYELLILIPMFVIMRKNVTNKTKLMFGVLYMIPHML